MKTGFIDWTEKGLAVYIFEKQSGGHILVDTSSAPLEEGLDREILKSLPAGSWDSACLSIPVDLLTLREQDFPFSDRDKIRETLPFELEGILLRSVADYVIDYLLLESYDISSKVLAVCLERSKVKEIIELFSSSGIELKTVTSLDLRLSGGKSEELLEETVSDQTKRSEAAADEVLHPTINLRQAEFAYRGDIDRFIKKLRGTALLVLVLLIILAASALVRFTHLKNEHSLLTGQLEALYQRVFPEDKKIIDPGRQFKGNMKMLTQKKDTLGGIPLLDIMRDIASGNDRKVFLNEFTTDGKNVIIKGTADSFEEVESLKNDYLSLFNDVKVTDSGATADKKIHFTIVMQEKSA